jgi:cytochrome b561
VTLFVVFDTFTTDVGSAKAFTWHPILMTAAFAVFMNEGLLQYYLGDVAKRERSESRTGHAILQLFACLLCIGGYIAIFVAHAAGKKSQFFSDDDEFLKKLHVCIGYLVLFFVLVQLYIGATKYITKKQTGESVYRWHGKTGIAVYAFGMFNLFLGCVFWKSPAWTTTENQPIATAFVIVLALITFIMRHVRTKLMERLKEGATGFNNSNEADGLLFKVDPDAASGTYNAIG